MMALRIFLLMAMTFDLFMLSSALPNEIIMEMLYPMRHSPHLASHHDPSTSFLNGDPHNPFNISQPCWDAFNRTVNNTIFRLITTGNFSKIDSVVADSFGKPGAGIMAGNINMIGHFDECENITGFKYCLSYFNVSSYYKGYPFPLMYGLCAPKVCQDADVYRMIELTGISEKAPLETVLCSNRPHQPFDWQFILTVIFFSVLFILVVSTSLYYAWYHSPACHRSGGFSRLEDSSTLVNDGGPQQETTDHTRGDLEKEPSELAGSESNGVHLQRQPEGKVLNTLNKVLFSFALPQNLPKLLSGKLSKDSIDCLHGIRVLSMLWVILGHVFAFGALMPMMNPSAFVDWLMRYNFLTVINAFFSVDSFFVLSGLLVTYTTLKYMKKKNGHIPWRWFYSHRYWRLTPALAITMLFWMYIVPYFGHGPYAAQMGNRTPCETYWWTNLLYINNFYPVQGIESCIPWVWYLANDMQFFAISPLILIPLYYMPLLGMLFIGILCLTSFLVIGLLTGIHNFSAAQLNGMNPGGGGSFSDIIYFKPYCRITPYLAGMVLGYILYKYPKKSIKMHWGIVLFNWIGACGVGYACIYSVYPNYDGHVWDMPANIVYEMFCRFAWGVSLSWIIFACHYGYGGWVNSLLGHPGWAPLSRLTYCAYLLHPIIITIYNGNLGTVSYLSLNLMAFNFAGVSLISYGCAAIFSLMVEFPLVSLEKLFIPRV